MWQILLHVTLTTVALTLAALAVLALAAARAYMRDRETTARVCRRVLAGAAGMYLLVLAAPVSSWQGVGTGERHVEWNPVRWAQELRGSPAPEDSFAFRLRDGKTAHFSENELTQAEREEVLPHGGSHDYFLHEDQRGGLVITGSAGAPVEGAEEQLVYQEAGPRIADFLEDRGAESAGLVLEEKVVNALLFVPIGIIAFYGVRGAVGRIAFGPGLALTLEAVQWAMGAGRFADMGDLLVSSLGSLTGTAMAGTCVLLAARASRTPASEEHAVRGSQGI